MSKIYVIKSYSNEWALFFSHASVSCILSHLLELCISEVLDLNLDSEISYIYLLKPTSYVMPQQFNIQQLYILPTLYLCVLYLSENKQRLVPPTA